MSCLTSEVSSPSRLQYTLPTVIGLEGLPYAGKTSLSSLLLDAGMSRLGELAEYFANGQQFPSFSETTADARESFDWFVKAELSRFAHLNEYPSRSLIISDRTLVSSLAYSYARRQVFQIGDKRDEHQAIERAVVDKGYYIPPLIYVRIPIETYFDRRESTYDLRCETLGKRAVENVTIFEREREFFEAQIEYYDMIAERLGDKLLVIDGTCDPRENSWNAMRWCSRTAKNYYSIPLKEILI